MLNTRELIRASDLRKNFQLFYPLLDVAWPLVHKEYYISDVMLMLDVWLGGFLLNPAEGEDKLNVALEEGVKARMLVACLRKSLRNSNKSRGCKLIQSLKQLLLKKLSTPPAAELHDREAAQQDTGIILAGFLLTYISKPTLKYNIRHGAPECSMDDCSR